MTDTSSSVVPDEVQQFASHARDWWDPDGSERMLHKLNPIRLAYLRDMVDQHWQGDEHGLRPLEGKSALDVGCGAGLLAEPLARLGATVTAVDAAAELVDVAREHAAGQGLEIDYRHAAVEDLGGQFDLVTSMEVIEHVADPQAFLMSLAARLPVPNTVCVRVSHRPQRRQARTVSASLSHPASSASGGAAGAGRERGTSGTMPSASSTASWRADIAYPAWLAAPSRGRRLSESRAHHRQSGRSAGSVRGSDR